MENKKSFILYTDWKTIFDELSDQEAGIMIKHIFKYVNDENPNLSDRLLSILFKPIQIQLKRDLKAWKEIQDKKSDAGKIGNLKRWHHDLYDLVESKKMSLDKAFNIAKDRTSSHTDRTSSQKVANIAVNVNDNVNGNVNDIIIKEEEKQKIIYRKYIADVNDDPQNYRDVLKDVMLSMESSIKTLLIESDIDYDDKKIKDIIWKDFLKNATVYTPQINNKDHAYKCFKLFIGKNKDKYKKQYSNFEGFE
jgi:hypothetical protein